MESESGMTNTKISDSGYSHSCSNSNSQRSASSKSRHSGSNSSRSSGYCGAPKPDESVGIALQPPKRSKDKKKKLKLTPSNSEPPLLDNKTTSNLSTEIIPTDQNIEIENVCVAPDTSIPPPESLKAIPEVLNTTVLMGELQGDPTILDDTISWVKEQIEEPAQHLKNLTVHLNAENIDTKTDTRPEDGFCCVISMYDGVVLYTTPSLTTVLGFPKDMWLGRSFIDFVHPKDRDTFSSQVTTGITLPLVDSQETKHSLYVCLRKYRGLRSSGFGVVEKSVRYQAFQLTVTFKNINNTAETKLLDNNSNMFLVVLAMPIYSSYKVPEEKRNSPKFGMRHTSACIFSHVDPDVVAHFGFLPQDMLGKSVFDFYHPEDMPFLKEIYESVMSLRQIAGSVFRSKPYRFAVQNGGFAMIETEWSSFVNPWSRRLEFVIGLHKVLQGPQNPDIFALPVIEEILPEEIIEEGKTIQEEIVFLLNKELSKSTEAAKHEVSKRCKDLANFMESLMDEVKRSNLQLDLPQDTDPTISVSMRKMERDSVMLGEISPHHDYYDSKSSSRTPPSYNQLNYNDNIQRFFQSKPKTTVSDESIDRSNNLPDTDQEAKALAECGNNQKCYSPVQNSGTSGSGSAEMLSSASNQNLETGTSATNTSNDSYKPSHLTEAVLSKHNEEMERFLLKQHRDLRTTSREKENRKIYNKFERPYATDKINNERIENLGQNHGVKRCGSYSWRGEGHKLSKHKHQSGTANGIVETANTNTTHKHLVPNPTTVPNESTSFQPSVHDVNLWPPFSVTVTPINNPTSASVASNPNFGMIPIYYFPTPQRPYGMDCFDPTLKTTPRYHVPYMPGMVYNCNALFPTSPIVCPTLPVLPLHVPPTLNPVVPEPHQMAQSMSVDTRVCDTRLATDPKTPASRILNNSQFQRPASQATSVKAEPGSAMGSIASASVANKALSECSRKDLGFQSVCSPDSPIVSPPDGDNLDNYANTKITKSNLTTHQENNDNNTLGDGSSYSSSYSSFLKTDIGSGSNDDSNAMDNKNNTSDENCWQNKTNFPIRKRDPPWLEAVSITPDLVYRYQMAVKGIEDILEKDLKVLRNLQQPKMVNDQLDQLYIEMQLEGLSTQLTLEEGITTSSSSSGEDCFLKKPTKLKKKRRSYGSLVMIYEENAPLPPSEN